MRGKVKESENTIFDVKMIIYDILPGGCKRIRTCMVKHGRLLISNWWLMQRNNESGDYLRS